MAKIFLPSHIWLRFFCRAGPPRKSHAIFGGDKSIYGSVKKTCEKNPPGSDLRSVPLRKKRVFLRFRYFFLFRYFPRLLRSSGKTRPFSFRKRTRKRKKFALFPCVFLSDRRWLCRKWHAIFGKAISARLSTCFFPLPLRGRGKKSSPKARPRESIRSPENCIQFSGDKSEIRAAGGLRKGEKRSVKKSQKGARNRRKQRFSPGIDLRSMPGENTRKKRVFLRFPSSPPIPSESEGTRRLPSKIASDFRRQAKVLFSWSFFFQKKDGFSPTPFGVGGNIGKKANFFLFRCPPKIP